MSKNIVFFNHHLDLRGTNTSMYNYAKYNEEILGNTSLIASWVGADSWPSSYSKFKARFDTRLVTPETLDEYLETVGADFFYHQRYGVVEFIPKEVPALIHAVFNTNSPHGHKYFYVSDWLAKLNGKPPTENSIPLIVDDFPPQQKSIRKQLGISDNQFLFGYHGDKFDLPWVRAVVEDICRSHEDYVFVFMHSRQFHVGEKPKNLIYIDGTWNMQEKSDFIHSCDAMIDGCTIGETFGMSVAEFTICNKPVVTWGSPPDRAHLEYMGHKAFLYNSEEELRNIILTIRDLPRYAEYRDCYDACSPLNIMKRFKNICLQ